MTNFNRIFFSDKKIFCAYEEESNVQSILDITFISSRNSTIAHYSSPRRTTL